VLLFIEVSEMKKTDKRNGMHDRKDDVDIVDWLLSIDLDPGKRAMS
jgi:hypothetical protein